MDTMESASSAHDPQSQLSAQDKQHQEDLSQQDIPPLQVSEASASAHPQSESLSLSSSLSHSNNVSVTQSHQSAEEEQQQQQPPPPQQQQQQEQQQEPTTTTPTTTTTTTPVTPSQQSDTQPQSMAANPSSAATANATPISVSAPENNNTQSQQHQRQEEQENQQKVRQPQPHSEAQQQQQPPSAPYSESTVTEQTPPPKKKRSLLRIPSRRSSKSTSQNKSDNNAASSADGADNSSRASTSKSKSSRFSTRRRSSAAGSEASQSTTAGPGGNSGGGRASIGAKSVASSTSAASSVMRRFSSSTGGGGDAKSSGSKHGRFSRRASGAAGDDGNATSEKQNNDRDQGAAGKSSVKEPATWTTAANGKNSSAAATNATNSATATTTANNKNNNTTAANNGSASATAKRSIANSNAGNTATSVPEKPAKAPSTFFAFFACCSSKDSATDEERSTPAPRPVKPGGNRQTNGTRQAIPSNASTALEKEKPRDKEKAGSLKDYQKGKNEPGLGPDGQLNEKQGAEGSGVSNEKDPQPQQQVQQSVKQTVAAAFGGTQPSPTQGDIAYDHKKSMEGETTIAGSIDSKQPQQKPTDTAAPVTASPEAVQKAATAAAVEQTTSKLAEPQAGDAAAATEEEPNDVDDETARALDEAVTSPTPIIPQSEDELEKGLARQPPDDTKVTAYPVRQEEDEEDSEADLAATTTQNQQQVPPPPSIPSPIMEFDQDGRRNLLPPLEPHMKSRKCLVLDLDETLVHSSFKALDKADFTIPVEIEGQLHNIYVIKRPGVDQFMKRVGELYEVVVFTASVSKYGDPLLDQLDIHNVVHHRLFRDSCQNVSGNYIKDLDRVGRDLREVIIIDNSPTSYMFHPQHAIPISSWFSDIHDNELLDLIPVLEDLAVSDVKDVRLVLDVKL